MEPPVLYGSGGRFLCALHTFAVRVNMARNMESSQPTPAGYKWLDLASGGVLMVLTVFLAWAFGVNGLPWALWTVRVLGWTLLLLLLGKWMICHFQGYRRPFHGRNEGARWPVIMLAVLTLLILLWVLISGLNPRADATFTRKATDYSFVVLNYKESYITYLPHTYDQTATRSVFLTYTALAGAFWAARHWFTGYSRRERHAASALPVGHLPDRMRWWLWLIILNAVALSLVGVIQKLDGTKNLLWLMPWGKDTTLEMPFGPFLYRANAAQYFNLIWPTALGFWWLLRHRALEANPNQPLGSDASVTLLPITGLLAASPAVALTRGGTILSVILLIASAVIFVTGRTRLRPATRLGLSITLLGALALIVVVAGRDLRARFERQDYSTLNGRSQMAAVGYRMAGDFRWLGSGPETIPAIYHLYRETPNDTDLSEGYLHNDWLETWVTFGWIGGSLVFGALILIPLIWWLGRGTVSPGIFCPQLFVSLGGMLLHASFDFPFQVVALLGTWLLMAALLTSFSHSRRTDR